MDIKNIKYVKQLLLELDNIETVKQDINSILNTAAKPDKEETKYLGEHIISLLFSSPLFGVELIKLLENKTNTIKNNLKEL